MQDFRCLASNKYMIQDLRSLPCNGSALANGWENQFEQGMTTLADLKKNLKSVWMKSMEAIGNTASNIASNTRYKVDEMNLQNRRREILNDFGAKAYALWLKGETFPESLSKQLEELQRVDNQLNDLRAERIASNLAVRQKDEMGADGEQTDDAKEDGKRDTADASPEMTAPTPGIAEDSADAGKTAEAQADEAIRPQEASLAPVATVSEDGVPTIQVAPPVPNDEKVSVHQAINDLFDPPSVNEMAEKVNQSLDSLHESLLQFSAKTDQQLEELTDQIHENE